MLHSGSASAFQAEGAGSIPAIRSEGPLAQLVRALPCHGRGRQFKSDMDRLASLVQWIEHRTSKPSVAGSIPARGASV